jgi:hypothetical protein
MTVSAMVDRISTAAAGRSDRNNPALKIFVKDS